MQEKQFYFIIQQNNCDIIFKIEPRTKHSYGCHFLLEVGDIHSLQSRVARVALAGEYLLLFHKLAAYLSSTAFE